MDIDKWEGITTHHAEIKEKQNMKTHLMPINLTEMKLTNTLKEINRQDSELKQISNATENFKSYFKKKKGKLYKELLTSCPHHFAHFTRAFY